MLSQAKNELLTKVGPGEPMGELLRRYWMPIAGVSEFDEVAVKPVRLLGEDLVLYKDLSGNFGLIDRQCPHRRADLAYGFVEKCGLRCNYHGWLYDQGGKCTEQPYEDVANPQLKLKERVKIKAYPVEEKAGLLWAYLGPQPAPLVPNWEPFSWKNGFVQIVISEVPCNWLQCQENSIDPIHFEWMHNNWTARLNGQTGPYSPAHKQLDFDEFDYGFIYKRLRGDADESDPLWSIGRVCLWPNAFFLGEHFEWRVPVDDARTLSVTWAFTRVPKESEPYEQKSVPTWHGPVTDPQTGRWITSHVMNQDFVAWAGQGVVADRTKENLGSSDRGIVMLRRRFFEELDVVANGGEPKGIIRDPKRNECVQLPIAARATFVEGMTRAEIANHPLWKHHLQDFRFQAGQPEHVRRAFLEAMGMEP
ncbi:aromatic ring-hydroxylating dioxygenase subunit alpha [Paraburkholderia sediminicola]|uniref:Rieske 2Fe-2S domain-containing protein n=1 Tax=Paraburkholderia sediminicola TaxID=458836 RepID=UPI0038BB3A7A